MKICRDLGVGVGLALAVVAASPASADIDIGQMTWTRVGGHYSGGGGEFSFWEVGTVDLNLSSYAASTRGRDNNPATRDFQTFCMETEENAGGIRYSVLSDTFIDEATGLVTGPGSHARRGGQPFGDNLDARTAFLYTKFATGQLLAASGPGYSYAGYTYTVGSNRESSAAALQAAIWKIEGAITGTLSVQAQALYDYALDATTVGGATNEWVNRGIGGVRVLNMYFDAGHTQFRQDQLYLIPLPGAALLGVAGVGAIAWIKRRIA